MPNWERTPPVSGMTVEEIKKRVADGMKQRRASGELRPDDLPEVVFKPDPSTPHLSKEQRRTIMQASNLAIYSLANNDRVDYCGAMSVINNVRKAVGLSSTFMQAIGDGVASAAAEASGEDFDVLDQLARRWLDDYYKPSAKVISIAKGKPSDG